MLSYKALPLPLSAISSMQLWLSLSPWYYIWHQQDHTIWNYPCTTLVHQLGTHYNSKKILLVTTKGQLPSACCEWADRILPELYNQNIADKIDVQLSNIWHPNAWINWSSLLHWLPMLINWNSVTMAANVTVNLTSFEELLVRQTTQKTQQNRWVDPSGDWRQNKGLLGLQDRETMGKWVTQVSKRENYLSLLSIVFSQEDRHPRVREAYRCWVDAEVQLNTKENLLW